MTDSHDGERLGIGLVDIAIGQRLVAHLTAANAQAYDRHSLTPRQ